MKKILILILLIFIGCSKLSDMRDEFDPKKNQEKKDLAKLGNFWRIISTINSNSTPYSGNCIPESTTLPTGNCEAAPLLSQNACVSSSAKKGTIKFFKYQANSSETLSMIVNPGKSNTTNNCVLAYKENRMVTENSQISDLESNQNANQCQTSSSVSMTSGAYRCISFHSFCDSPYFIKISNSQGDLIVSGGGTTNNTLPSSWSASNGTFASITGFHSPVVGTNSSSIIPLGFTFTFFGKAYSNVYVSSNGFLSFSDLALKYSSNQNNLYGSSYSVYGYSSSDPILLSVIAPWWANLYVDCDSSVQYLTSGTAPNRVFTVEWKNVTYYPYTYRINFQAKIYETTNITEFIYGSSSGFSSSSSLKASIGISNSVGGNGNYVNGRTGSSTDTSLYSPANFPALGIVYRFTP